MPGSFRQCCVSRSNWKSSCKRGPGPWSLVCTTSRPWPSGEGPQKKTTAKRPAPRQVRIDDSRGCNKDRLHTSGSFGTTGNGSAEVPGVHAEEDPALTNAQSDMDVHRMYATRSTLNRCALWHRASPELYDETDDAEYGRDAHTPSEPGRPGCSAPVVGMGAPRDVDPERGEQNDASRRSGYGRPKKPVHGLPLNTAQAPLACGSAGQRLFPHPKKPLPKGKPPAHAAEGLAPRSASQAVTTCAGVPAAGVII